MFMWMNLKQHFPPYFGLEVINIFPLSAGVAVIIHVLHPHNLITSCGYILNQSRDFGWCRMFSSVLNNEAGAQQNLMFLALF